MDFMEISEKRRSVRKYSNKPVEREKFEKILEAGRRSLSETVFYHKYE